MSWTPDDDVISGILRDIEYEKRDRSNEEIARDVFEGLKPGHSALGDRPEWLGDFADWVGANGGRSIMAGGLANVADKIFWGQDPSYADYVMGSLDVPGTGTAAKAVGLGAGLGAGIIRGIKGFDPLKVGQEWAQIGKAPVSAQSTQIQQTAKADPTKPAGTGGTYAKMAPMLDEGPTLDFGAGKGEGTQFLGRPADRYEPFPGGWSPEFSDSTQIPAGNYQNVVNSATLNVTPPLTSEMQMRQMAAALRPGGQVLTSARSKAAVDAAKTKVPVEGLPGYNIPNRGYQEGYTPDKMRGLMERSGLDYQKTRAFGEEAAIGTPVPHDPSIVELVNKAAKLGAGKSNLDKPGKLIGGDTYIHRDYAFHVVPTDKLAKVAEQAAADGFTWNTVKKGKDGSITLQYSPDFDTADEPMVKAFMAFDRDGNLKKAQTYKDGKEPIWHHKWQWVSDDYDGFNFKDAVQRSVDWQSKMKGKSRSGIGNRKNFEKAMK